MQTYLKALHEISIELTRTNSLEDFYRRTVELGLSRLGFDRMGFWRYDPDKHLTNGTYGTDMQGRNVVSEHHFIFDPSQFNTIIQVALSRTERFTFQSETTLYDHQGAVTGWNAIAALWDTDMLGWLSMDNAIHHHPVAPAQLEIFALYGWTVGALLARKQAEATLYTVSQRLALATSSGGIGIWDWDIPNDVLYWDGRMYELYRVTNGKPVGTVETWRRALHPEDRDPMQVEVNLALSGKKPFDSEFRVIWANGMVRHIKGKAIVLWDSQGVPQRMIGVNIDITETKQAMAKEKELGELKSRFVSMASHEFRTPLATILASTETLKAYRPKLTEEQIEQKLRQEIQDQVGHLKSIMDDVLQLARLQARRFEVNLVLLDLDVLCRNVLDELTNTPDFAHQIAYTCRDDTHTGRAAYEANLDKRLMLQIINNLVANAVDTTTGQTYPY